MIYVTDLHGAMNPHAHLFSDKSEEELLQFADNTLGLAPERAHWKAGKKQDIREFHFDISEPERNTCIFCGALAFKKEKKNDNKSPKVITT